MKRRSAVEIRRRAVLASQRDPVLIFEVDQDAKPHNVLPALARLLIDIDRRERARPAAEQLGS